MKKNWLVIFIGVVFVLLLGVVSCNMPTKTPAPPVNNPTSPAEEPTCPAVTSPDGAELVLIQAGQFAMGSPASSTVEDEKPQHNISLGCYSIYKKEVTNKMYAACVSAGICMPIVEQTEGMTHFASDPAYADNPAVGVDYNMATDYCTWIGGRLPTEAEWEYAALGATNRTYPWGNTDPTCENADFQGCVDPAGTVKVGTLIKGESPFKVDDLSGNAFEWVFDWYAKDFYANSPASNPVGPLTGVTKVVRGGAFTTNTDMLRGANRHGADPYMAYSNVGFRCVIQTGFSLPEEYNKPTPHKHHIPHKNTNLNGNDPGDPGDNGGWIFAIPPMSCPDPNGNTHATVFFGSNDGSMLNSLEVYDANNLVPFVCGPYDPNTSTYDCQVGPLAPVQGNSYNGKVCIKDADQMNICIEPYPLFVPQDCGNSQGLSNANAEVGCPVNDKILAKFYFDPPVVWDYFMIGNGTPMDCHPTSPTQLECLAPNILTNSQYEFKLSGLGQQGNFTWYPIVQPPDNCAGDDTKGNALYFAFCDKENNANLDILYSPPNATLDAVELNGQMMQCMDQGGNNAHCPIAEFNQGQLLPLKICVSGECLVDDLQVPDCSTIPQYTFKVDPFCDAKGVGIHIHFIPAPPSAPTTITANGLDLNCGQNSPTDWTCGGLPGQPNDPLAIKIYYQNSPTDLVDIVRPFCDGDIATWSTLGCSPATGEYYFITDILPLTDANKIISVELNGQQLVDQLPNLLWDFWVEPIDLNAGDTVTFKVCYADGSCRDFTHVVPDCKKPPISCPCRLIDVQCLSESKFAFIVQTCPADPQPLVIGSVTAKDSQSYSCDLIPSFDGRVYCAGPNPVSSTPLSLWWVNGNDQSNGTCTLTNWPPSIPACPTPVPQLPQCSQYTDPTTCRLNKCTWVVPPTGGPGSCK